MHYYIAYSMKLVLDPHQQHLHSISLSCDHHRPLFLYLFSSQMGNLSEGVKDYLFVFISSGGRKQRTADY